MAFLDFVYTNHKKPWMQVLRAPLNVMRRFYRRQRILIGEKLGLPVPRESTMKLEWLKYFDKNPLMPIYADKIAVKEHLLKFLPDKYIIKTLGVYNNASGTNIIVKDKEKLDIPSTRKKLDCWLNKGFGAKEHEWQYLAIKPKILCEEFIETNGGRFKRL